MRKRFIPIYSVLIVAIVLLAVFVPSCTPTATGTIQVQATLCDVPWQGLVNYTLTPGTGSPVSGTVVPASFNVSTGSWTCAYVAGGPAGAYLKSITPSATQSLSEGGTITFTLNFELDQDAGIEFITWTQDGIPWQGDMEVVPCMIVDAHFKQWVDGCEGRVVAVNETSWLKITQVAGPPGVMIHVINDWCALNKTPEPIDKESQVPSFNGDSVEKGMFFPLDFQVPVDLDVETAWQLAKCLNYTKSINWLGISLMEPVPGHECVLFELVVPFPGMVYQFALQASAEVALVDDVDVDLENNLAIGPPLLLTVIVP